MYTVEDLTAHDYKWAVHTAARKMMVDEVKRPDLYDIKQFELLANLMMEQKTVLIVKKNGRPAGVLGALPNNCLYNPSVVILSEILWYVLPEHRGGRSGYLLLKAFRDLADKMNLEASLSSLAHSEVNDKSLERLGFVYAERAYSYRK